MQGIPQPLYPAPRPAQHRTTRQPLSPILIALLVAGGLGVVTVVVLFVGAALVVNSIYRSSNVLPNVTVQGNGIQPISVGGMSPTDAQTALKSMTVNKTITFTDGATTYPVSSTDLGISVDTAATAAKAVQAGRDDGSVITGLSAMLHGAQVAPVYTMDLTKAQAALDALGTKINTTPDPSQPTSTGKTLNVGATLDKFPPDIGTLLQTGTTALVFDTVQGPRTQYTVQSGEQLGLISKKFNVPVSDIMSLNNITDANTIYPGQVLTIPAAGVWQPTAADAPPAPTQSGKAIVVSLQNQRIYAYQDGQLVHSSLMSSGLPESETVTGDYHVYVKYVTTRMTGPGYDIPDVPWTMYFYQGYGIHGAYWHNDFGIEMSHGCVNLPTDEAKWFYDFTPVGTLVRILPA